MQSPANFDKIQPVQIRGHHFLQEDDVMNSITQYPLFVHCIFRSPTLMGGLHMLDFEGSTQPTRETEFRFVFT